MFQVKDVSIFQRRPFKCQLRTSSVVCILTSFWGLRTKTLVAIPVCHFQTFFLVFRCFSTKNEVKQLKNSVFSI